MSLPLFARKALLCWSLTIAVPGILLGQGNYETNGSQYPITGMMAGDQAHPQLSLSASGGFLVWEDNATDGFGLGISAVRLDSSFSPAYAPFRVNSIAQGDQEQPRVSLMNDGGAAFVWQGGVPGYQQVYARLLSSANTWVSPDILVNSAGATNKAHFTASVATLANGNVVVVYGSLNQASTNSMQDVYGQILSPSGQKVGGEFLVNQFTAFNQRSPSVAALAGGGFVVVFVTEQQRSGSVDVIDPNYLYPATNLSSVDIFGRVYMASGTPAGPEFMINTAYEICSSPQVAAGSDGGFMVTWAQKTRPIPAVGWDIYARPFSANGAGGSVAVANNYTYGDQYDPQISALGNDYFIVWTSLGQDGSREGVFGRFIRATGVPAGSEVRVNTTTIGQQKHPCVASDGNGRFLSTWTSFVGGVGSFDLFAQRWVNVAQPLVPMDPPFVWAPFVVNRIGTNDIYQPQLQISWPMISGMAIDHYEVFVDGAPYPRANLTNNIWLMTAADGLTASSTHSFQVAYVAADGRRSPLSAATSATAYSGYNWGGIPFEWMSLYYGGNNVFNWPQPSMRVAADGPTLQDVFLTGASPLDSSTWLRTSVVGTPQGYFLTWNPQPGLVYQVQTSVDLQQWANLGTTRFATEKADSIYIGGNNNAYYRILRLR